MNIRKNIDYSGLYAEIDKAIISDLSQMELYLELGKLVSGRPEKGAAVMAAEYITANYPNRGGFSPRNLRRMRDFYWMYESYPKVLNQAMPEYCHPGGRPEYGSSVLVSPGYPAVWLVQGGADRAD